MYSLVCLVGGLECNLYNLSRSITLTELFNVFHLTELQQDLFQIFEPDAARHVADHYLVGTESRKKKQIRSELATKTCMRARVRGTRIREAHVLRYFLRGWRTGNNNAKKKNKTRYRRFSTSLRNVRCLVPVVCSCCGGTFERAKFSNSVRNFFDFFYSISFLLL